MKIDKKTVGSNIKKLREEAGLNQKQVAQYLQVDQSLISKFESGERVIGIEMLDQLAALFCCPLEVLTTQSNPSSSMAFAFRATGIDADDLSALATIHRIALNQMQMDEMMKEE